MNCTFNLAYRGHCGVESDTDRCVQHRGLYCAGCGAWATGECCHTMQLVCGAPLCRDCEHGDGRKMEHRRIAK